MWNQSRNAQGCEQQVLWLWRGPERCAHVEWEFFILWFVTIIKMNKKKEKRKYENKDKHKAWIASTTVLSQMYVVIW